MADYRIDDLAKKVGTTVRNIRAYQDRGLLAPPRLLGRVGIYSESHVARLRHITSLLGRGYASAQIHELLHAWEQGKDIGAVIDLEGAVTDPWSDEQPEDRPTATLRASLDGEAGTDHFDRLVALGWIEPHGDTSRVRSPRLLGALEETTAFGFDPGDIVKLYETIDPAVHDVACTLVGTAVSHLLAEHGDAWVPDADESAELAAMLVRLRQLTVVTVRLVLAKAMESTMQDALGQHLERIKSSERPAD